MLLYSTNQNTSNERGKRWQRERILLPAQYDKYALGKKVQSVTLHCFLLNGMLEERCQYSHSLASSWPCIFCYEISAKCIFGGLSHHWRPQKSGRPLKVSPQLLSYWIWNATLCYSCQLTPPKLPGPSFKSQEVMCETSLGPTGVLMSTVHYKETDTPKMAFVSVQCLS